MIKLKNNTLIPPNHQKVCSNEDDYIQLINWCWEKIGEINTGLVEINLYKTDSVHEMNYYKDVLRTLHTRIKECYEHLILVGNEGDVSHVSHVFTAPTNSKGRKA